MCSPCMSTGLRCGPCKAANAGPPNRALEPHAILRSVRTIAFAVFAMTTLLDMALAAERTRDRLVGAGSGSTTIEQALGLAYRNNPQLNAQRAATRATDENVPTALAGYRPRATGTSSLTEQYLDNLTKSGTTPGGAALYTKRKAPPPCRPSA